MRLVEEADDPAKVRILIARLGAVTAIVDALRRHSTDFRMPEAGCAALAKLAEGSPPQICEALLERGGIDAVLKAMLLYPAELKVQQAGTSVLVSLAAPSSDQQEIVSS